MTKFGVNSPCWCGSGKKYKKCHLGRDQEIPPSIFEIAKDQQKYFNKKYCLSNKKFLHECSGKIIKAHTVQKKILKNISSDGHVYTMIIDLINLIYNVGIFKPQFIGINDASTFTGFCSYHDNKIFEPLENNLFISNHESAFLLSYRAVCMELYKKKYLNNFLPYMKSLDRGFNENMQNIYQNEINTLSEGAKVGLTNLESIKSHFDDVLLAGDYSNVKYLIYQIDSKPKILCNGCFYPDFDFLGNRIQNIADLSHELDMIGFSIVETTQGGALVFSWINDFNHSCSIFINSLLSHPLTIVPNLILKMIFAFLENIYFSPGWWDSLNDKKKNYLLDKFKLQALPYLTRDENCIIDDAFNIVNWNITRIDKFVT